MKLSKFERLLLANQYRILSKLDPQDVSHDKMREALEEGYEAAYQDELFRHILEVLPEEECSLVLDVMELYWSIQRSYDELVDKSGIEERDVVFSGFDGNHETAYMTYARYLRDKDGRYPYLKLGWDGVNSHTPMLDRYRAQIGVWKSMDKKRDLTREDILSILR